MSILNYGLGGDEMGGGAAGLPGGMPLLCGAEGSFLAAANNKKTKTAAASGSIRQYCVGCHNNKLKTAGLALDALASEKIDQRQEEWEKVVRKLRPRYMPPPGLPRPDERTYGMLVSSLESALDRAAA